MKNKRNISQSLALATTTLLSSVPFVSQAELSPVSVDASQLYYSEEDRVTVYKSQVSATKVFSEDESLSADFIFDTMTGASPNGRYVFDADLSITPVTSASGNKILDVVNQTNAVKTWLTPFKETRVAGSAAWVRSWTRLFRSTVDLNVSQEGDYRSTGGSSTFELDVNQRRTTLVAGASLSLDTIMPQTKIPEAKAPLWCNDSFSDIPTWLSCGGSYKRYDTGSKTSQDYLLGVTQVWNRNTILQLNYSFAQVNGYLTDPYKTISVVKFDTATVDPQHQETAVLHEKRPDARDMARVFLRMVYSTERDAIHLSYRYYWDNWDVYSHTFDGSLIVNVKSRHTIEPHFRLSTQNSAFFFQEALDSNAGEPAFVSADHRLGAQTTYTYGLKYGLRYKKDVDMSLRVEKMRQEYKASRLPEMNAWIAQFIFKTSF